MKIIRNCMDDFHTLCYLMMPCFFGVMRDVYKRQVYQWYILHKWAMSYCLLKIVSVLMHVILSVMYYFYQSFPLLNTCWKDWEFPNAKEGHRNWRCSDRQRRWCCLLYTSVNKAPEAKVNAEKEKLEGYKAQYAIVGKQLEEMEKRR